MLASVSNTLEGEVLEYAADVSTALGRLGERLRSNPVPILYSTMIRSESISSSWIEGIRENPRAIAIAQIGDDTASHNASSVIRNVDAMNEAIELLGVGAWTHEDVLDIHHDLLPGIGSAIEPSRCGSAVATSSTPTTRDPRTS